jgi:hypothetical protein
MIKTANKAMAMLFDLPSNLLCIELSCSFGFWPPADWSAGLIPTSLPLNGLGQNYSSALCSTLANSLGLVKLHDSPVMNREHHGAIPYAPQRQSNFAQ